VLLGIPRAETVNAKSLAPVRAARAALARTPGVVGISGEGAIELDYQHAVFGNFALMFAIIALLTIALLTRAFRSLVLAVKAVALNLVSMGAAFGLMTWFWQEGHGSNALFGVPPTGAITFWIPLMVFAFLFGLSMDYEVFILARVREEYDRTGETDSAVVEGLGRTGRLVTSAALILFLAFASLASAPNTDVKVLATGLGFGILLDATIVRALLLPLKAVVLNVISVAAAWGVLELVWQAGHGSQQIWGIAATGSVTAWIPLMVFAFLFGLSMDYEVFILARMREEYDASGSTDTAVVRGIGRTGRLVTSAALILFLAFTSLASGPETEVKVLATGLAAGILLDATVIRALLVPAVISLFGRWNWWLPHLPARLLRVEPSPLGRLRPELEGSR